MATLDVPTIVGDASQSIPPAAHPHKERETVYGDSQIPPDLVVKSQTVDIVEVI